MRDERIEGNNFEDYAFKDTVITANITPGFTRISAPLWVSGQDAFLVICRSRVGRYTVYIAHVEMLLQAVGNL